VASGWKGMATGALGLVALETVLQPQASGRLGNLLALPAGWANRFLDPAVPALHKGTAPAAAAGPVGPAVPDWTTGGAGADWGPNPAPRRAPHQAVLPTN